MTVKDKSNSPLLLASVSGSFQSVVPVRVGVVGWLRISPASPQPPMSLEPYQHHTMKEEIAIWQRTNIYSRGQYILRGRWSQGLTPREDGSFSHHFQRLIEPDGSGLRRGSIYIIWKAQTPKSMASKERAIQSNRRHLWKSPNLESFFNPTKQRALRSTNSRKWWGVYYDEGK